MMRGWKIKTGLVRIPRLSASLFLSKSNVVFFSLPRIRTVRNQTTLNVHFLFFNMCFFCLNSWNGRRQQICLFRKPKWDFTKPKWDFRKPTYDSATYGTVRQLLILNGTLSIWSNSSLKYLLNLVLSMPEGELTDILEKFLFKNMQNWHLQDQTSAMQHHQIQIFLPFVLPSNVFSEEWFKLLKLPNTTN